MFRKLFFKKITKPTVRVSRRTIAKQAGDHLIQSSLESLGLDQIIGALSSQILNFSSKGDFITSLGTLFQWLIVCMVELFFLISRTEFLLKQLFPMPLLLPPCNLAKREPPLCLHLSLDMGRWWLSFPLVFYSWGWESQFCQSHFRHQVLPLF